MVDASFVNLIPIYKSAYWQFHGASIRELRRVDAPASYISQNNLCKQIGQITVNWSIVDQELDLWGYIFFEQLGGKNIRKVLPKGIGNRADYLKECFRKFPVLAPLCDEATALVIRATNVSKSRDDLVHGVVRKINLDDDNYKLHKFDHTPTGLVYREVSINDQRLRAIANDCANLAEDVRVMSARLEKILPPAQ